MNKIILYGFLLIGLFSACEDIYTPVIDRVENVMVVDARIVYGNTDNTIKLFESRSFYESGINYPGISGASVSLVSSDGKEEVLSETSAGTFPVQVQLNPELEYKLKITYRGDSYESTFEPVPAVPELDTVYGFPEKKIVKTGGTNDVNDFREKVGVQLYTDIKNEKESPWFRFTSRKILQYTYQVEVVEMGTAIIETMYGWYSYYPQESFNIAAPPEFSGSTDIVKQPLYYMEQKALKDPTHFFQGWILILYQYGLSKNGYNYYKDLNNQLDADGRLFDPVYVQARNNLKCTSNSKQIILGNFEISSVRETRYFVQYVSEDEGYIIKPIPYFYPISESGEQLIDQPDFWEYESKKYPND